eukprot:m.8024 g.8024  ORF g.8024 m.8024 type:complete len:152 (+) comp9002_c0_seq2:665-1120(+)
MDPVTCFTKRAKFHNPSGDNELCPICAHHTSTTLGELVRIAYTKNQVMREETEGPLHRLVRQRALWSSFRQTFFAPNVDSDALSNAPALAHYERLAYPCHCRHPTPLSTLHPSCTWSQDAVIKKLPLGATQAQDVRNSPRSSRLAISTTFS